MIGIWRNTFIYFCLLLDKICLNGKTIWNTLISIIVSKSMFTGIYQIVCMCCELLFGSNVSLLQTLNLDSLLNNLFGLPRKIYYFCFIILGFLNIVELQMTNLISSNILIRFCKSYLNNNSLFSWWFFLREIDIIF